MKKYYKVHAKFLGIKKRQRKVKDHFVHLGYTENIESMQRDKFESIAFDTLDKDFKEIHSGVYLSYTECSFDGTFETLYFGANNNSLINISTFNKSEAMS